MPHEHKQVPGSCRYKDCTDKMLEECVQRVKSGNLTQRNAEKEYKISKSTVKNKLAGKHPKSVFWSQVLSFNEKD